MFRRIRRLMVGVGLLVLASGGASIFAAPDYQVLYSPDPPRRVCTSAGCLGIYVLEIGNTGRLAQEHVRVGLYRKELDVAMLKPTVRTFGKVDRPVVMSEESGVRTYDLGLMKPRDRVELQVVLGLRPQDPPPEWTKMLATVSAEHGEVSRGSPAGITLGRILYAFFGAG
jgi:hypothetical protein